MDVKPGDILQVIANGALVYVIPDGADCTTPSKVAENTGLYVEYTPPAVPVTGGSAD